MRVSMCFLANTRFSLGARGDCTSCSMGVLKRFSRSESVDFEHIEYAGSILHDPCGQVNRSLQRILKNFFEKFCVRPVAESGQTRVCSIDFA